MKKIDMYKETPQSFHNKVSDTLEHLEEKKVVKMPARKYAVACAVAIFLFSSITVGAIELFQWYQTARERFDTDKELEDKLTMEGTTLHGEGTDVAGGIEVVALQSVKKNNGYYFLAGFQWPEDIEWNGDIVFESSTIITQQEAVACVANFTGAPDEDGMMYVEVEVNGGQIKQESGEIKLVLTNIAQAEKSVIANILVEAEWELAFHLPTSTDSKNYEITQKLLVNHHELEIDRIEVGSFGIRIYTAEEEAQHAIMYSNMWLDTVLYNDKTEHKQSENPLRRCLSYDEDGNFYFEIPLENAVDKDKVSGLVFKELEETFTLTLGGFVPAEQEETLKDGEEIWFDIADVTQMEVCDIIYEKDDNVICSDDTYLYLWDKKCSSAKILMRLVDYGYNRELGGEIVAQMGTGGRTIVIKPYSDSEKVYLWKLEYPEIIENDAKDIWIEE